MNVLDLFSGIGGFSLGLERAGMHTVAFCERDEYCRAVLRKHWPDVPCFDDIHTIDADGLARLGRIDLVCGGFPCQPFSVAGKQKGKEDDRHLWPQMCRVIALARPTWVIGENVAGLIAMALDDVLADLENLGYTARTFVIPAAAVGAPHRRDRLWIVATNTNGKQHESGSHADERTPASELSVTDSNRADVRQQSGRSDGAHGESSLQPGYDGEARHVADPCCIEQSQKPQGNDDEPEQRAAEWGRQFLTSRTRAGCRVIDGDLPQRDAPAGSSAARDARTDPQDVADAASARLQNAGYEQRAASDSQPGQSHFRDTYDGGHWSVEPDVGRVAHGVPKRVDRLRCLGNAVVPQIPEIIGRAIMSTAVGESLE
jgi:DNA (cytosine-5)-methyltransferase 1